MRFAPHALIVAALSLIALAAVAPAPAARADSPFVSFSSPKDGDVVTDLPPILVICFRKPFDISRAAVADYKFSLTQTGGAPLPLTVYGQNDAYGIIVQPGASADDPAGEWTFEWSVKDADTHQVQEDTMTFRVDAKGKAPMTTLSSPCTASGLGSASPAPGQSGSANNPSASAGDNRLHPDILLMSLLTLAGIGGLIVISLIGYAVRAKTGFWLHRPPPPGEAMGGPEHH